MNRHMRSVLALAVVVATMLTSFPTVPAVAGAKPPLIISEFRLHGPNGVADEFVEIYNNSDTAHTVRPDDGSAGYALASSNYKVTCVIPVGTVIPGRGHFLCAQSSGYTLGAYPAGNGTTTVGDATSTLSIADNAGIALFSTANKSNFSFATRLDAVGSTGEWDALYKEGYGYPSITGYNLESSFTRRPCVAMPLTCSGLPQDSDDNANDFVFADTNGTVAGAGQKLGAPGPENLSSPGYLASGAGLSRTLLDPASSLSAPPNRLRNLTPGSSETSRYGTVTFRRTFTNNTNFAITRLRFRIIGLTTFPSPSGVADLRPISSPRVLVTINGVSTSVQGTSLEAPPAQPNGGGINSSLSANVVTVSAPLQPGASIRLQFLFGIQTTGSYKFAIVNETLPFAGMNEVWSLSGITGTANDTEY